MATHKVEYQEDKASTEKFFVFADEEFLESWKKDKSIPLSSVLQTFDIFIDRGVKGEPERPSKHELESVFGTHNEEEVCKFILQNGRVKASNARINVDRLSTIYQESPKTAHGYEAANVPNVQHHHANR